MYYIFNTIHKQNNIILALTNKQNKKQNPSFLYKSMCVKLTLV